MWAILASLGGYILPVCPPTTLGGTLTPLYMPPRTIYTPPYEPHGAHCGPPCPLCAPLACPINTSVRDINGDRLCGEKRCLFHLRNKPLRPRKQPYNGKETRHREPSRTRTSRIL